MEDRDGTSGPTEVLYQPIIALDSVASSGVDGPGDVADPSSTADPAGSARAAGQVVAVEALLRVPAGASPGAAARSPLELLTAAREAGRLTSLEQGAVHAALAGLAGLRSACVFLNLEPCTIASLRQEQLQELAGAVPQGVQVVLEITERDLLRQPAQLLEGVERIRSLGWAIAVDDVGAEPAALALLPFLQPHVIKLDARVVQRAPGLQVARLLNAVHAEAERSGALVLAEGIETPLHLQRARAVGAVLGQGWLFAPAGPLPSRWGIPLRFPGQAARRPGCTPFRVLAQESEPARAPAALLTAVSRQIESQAFLQSEDTVVLSAFQDVSAMTPATRRRYEALARAATFTGVIGPGMPSRPCAGVTVADLAADSPLLGEWVVSVVGPHFAAVLAARRPPAEDVGEAVPVSADSVLEYVLSYDRRRAVEAARTLLHHLRPHADGLDDADGLDGADGAGGPEVPDARQLLGEPAACEEPEGGAPPGVPASAPAAGGGGSAGAGGAGAAPAPAPLSQREADEVIRAAIAVAPAGVTIHDARVPGLPLVHANEAFCAMVRQPIEGVQGRQLLSAAGRRTDVHSLQAALRRLQAGRREQVVWRCYRSDGTSFWNETRFTPVRDGSGLVSHLVGHHSDVSDRVRLERDVEHRADHDALTGLWNRRRLLEHLDEQLARARADGGAVAVLFVDLDDFKVVNDVHGHAVGDQALVALAQRLLEVVAEDGAGGAVARMGGDEFVIAVGEGGDAGAARRGAAATAARLDEALEVSLREPLALPGARVGVRASIGTALFPQHGTTSSQLLDHADAAMYRIKRRSG
ncbi:diguanylate cyclase domain-containing protein [Kineococcus sp. SYSU DK006]|uniref:diguanylate cyclase domain-containing protein n=1 Tax=Kineococcus sp. SYSU DK006 TaxID=3383127 RepID=UPI003D7E4AD9